MNLELLGHSVQGRWIPYCRLGGGPQVALFLGVIHGDEPAGERLLTRLVEHLGKHELPSGVSVVVCPCLNPDGLVLGTRGNSRGVDLNRNFPTQDWKAASQGDRYWSGPRAASEPETALVIELLEALRPRLLVTIHSDLANVNFDGPAGRIAEIMAERNGLPVAPDIGYPTPGSLGTFAGKERGIATITLELAEERPADPWTRHGGALLAALETLGSGG